MPGEGRTEQALFKRNYVQGLVTTHVAKGLRIAPYLSKETVDADNYVFYVEDYSPQGAIDAGIQDAPQVRAGGSELKIVRTSGMTAKSQPVLMTGFRYRVETDKIEETPNSIERYLARLSYGIGKTMETDVISALGGAASASTASLTNSVWSGSTGIDQDIVKMQAAFYDDSLPDVLSGIFYEAVNFKELRLFRRAEEGDGGGFQDMNTMDWLGTRHMYGGAGMTHGTAIGFDINNPPAALVYGTEKGAFQPSVLKGMEGYAPVINVKVKQEDDEIPRQTEIFVAAKYTIAVDTPSAIQKQTGL